MVTGAPDVDAGVGLVRDRVLPVLDQQRGFRGITVAGDRATGTLTLAVLWDSEADLAASDSAADKLRADVVEDLGGSAPTVERYEQVVSVVGDPPPGPGVKLHIRTSRSDPARLDDMVEYFRRRVLPALQAAPGFRGTRLLLDRRTGEGRLGTLWSDDESLRAWLAGTEPRRAAAAEQGTEFGQDWTLEVLLAAMRD